MKSVSKKPAYIRRYHPRRAVILVALGVLALLTASGAVSWSSPTRAQGETSPEVLVDASNFPEVAVVVLCPVKESNWMLEEDGVQQQILSIAPDETRPRKTETTMFVDIYDDKHFVLDETATSVFSLIETAESQNPFLLDRDYFSAVMPGAEAESIYELAGRTDELGLLVNRLRMLGEDGRPLMPVNKRPYVNWSVTPLASLLLRVLEDIPSSDAQVRRSLLVVSDGSDRRSGDRFDKLIEDAAAKRVAIHTVYVNTSPGNKDNLKNLAARTGGTYFESLNELDWAVLISSQRTCKLTYRSANAQAKQIVVTELNEGMSKHSVGRFAEMTVSAPRVEVHIPMPVETGVQSLQEMTISWHLDNYPGRRLDSLGYEIKGAAQTIAEELEPPPAAEGAITVSLDLDNLIPGAYAIRVWVEDELGLRGENVIPLQVTAPPTPSPTPTLISTPIPAPTPTLAPIWWESATTWTMTDFPYRGLLLATVLTSTLLAATAIWLVVRPPQGPEPSSPISLFSEPKRARAILYRVDSTVSAGVKQIVKLCDGDLNVPKDLFLEEYRNQIQPPEAALHDFEAVISSRGNGYYLQKIKGHIGLIKSGRSEPIKEQRLRNRDEIEFGKRESEDTATAYYRYLYVEIGESSEQNGLQYIGDFSAQ